MFFLLELALTDLVSLAFSGSLPASDSLIESDSLADLGFLAPLLSLAGLPFFDLPKIDFVFFPLGTSGAGGETSSANFTVGLP